jgi:hypothetical protein
VDEEQGDDRLVQGDPHARRKAQLLAAGSGAAAAPGQRAALAGPGPPPPPPPPPLLDPIDNLLPLNMGPLYNKIINDTAFIDRFGYLTLMAVCSRHQIGAFNAEKPRAFASASSLKQTS